MLKGCGNRMAYEIIALTGASRALWHLTAATARPTLVNLDCWNLERIITGQMPGKYEGASMYSTAKSHQAKSYNHALH